MNLNEIFESAFGPNENGEAKAAVTITHFIQEDGSDKAKIKNEYSVRNPITDLNFSEIATELLLIFNSSLDNDMRIIWSMINSFKNDVRNSIENKDGIIHTLMLNIVPMDVEEVCYVNAISPIFISLQSSSINETANTISLIFPNDDVRFYETDDIDIQEIESEVERKIMEIERQESIAEQKRQEKEEIENRRNELIRKRRGF